MSDLGTLGTDDSKAFGINNLGQIVGEAYGSNGGEPGTSGRALLFSNGTITNLGAPSGEGSAAFGINDSSQIVGDYTTNIGFVNTNDFGKETAFLYDNGVTNNLSAVGGLGALRAYTAAAINNQGQVTGYAINSNNTIRHAYLYSGGTMSDLGTLDSARTNTEGLALNNQGQVVGIAATNLTFDQGPFNSSHAFFYSGGTMLDLNNLTTVPSGWTLQSATGINDHGQIVGYGINAARTERAFLLTPMPVLSIAAAGSDVTIAWATNGLNFTLLTSPDVAATNWTALTNAPVVANGSNQVTVSATDASGFYRLMLAQ
jgi:probable HAF family extracellular repeat protein